MSGRLLYSRSIRHQISCGSLSVGFVSLLKEFMVLLKCQIPHLGCLNIFMELLMIMGNV